MFTFGQIPACDGDVRFESALSDDKRALTLTFSDLVASVEANKSQSPIVTRALSLVLPVDGGSGRAEIEFVASAFVITAARTTATLMLSVNGQTTIRDFPVGADEAFEQRLMFAADSPSECRLFALLLVGRDSQNTNGEGAFMNILSIDAEVLPRPS